MLRGKGIVSSALRRSLLNIASHFRAIETTSPISLQVTDAVSPILANVYNSALYEHDQANWARFVKDEYFGDGLFHLLV